MINDFSRSAIADTGAIFRCKFMQTLAFAFCGHSHFEISSFGISGPETAQIVPLH